MRVFESFEGFQKAEMSREGRKERVLELINVNGEGKSLIISGGGWGRGASRSTFYNGRNDQKNNTL